MIAFLLGSKVDLIVVMRALALMVEVVVISVAWPRRRSSFSIVRILLRHLSAAGPPL